MYSTLGRRGVHNTPKPVYKGLRVRIGVHAGIHADPGEEGGQIQAQYDKVAKGYDYYGPVVNAAARIESMAFGGQTLISAEVLSALSKGVKDQCLLRTIGALELKGIENEMFLHQVLPKTLKGRAFKGVFRRRDSDGGSIADNSESFLSRGSSIIVGGSFLDEEDMTSDVMTLTPIQLQHVVRRLRNKISTLESVLPSRGLRASDQLRQSDVTIDPFEFNEEISVHERRSSISRNMSDLDSSVLVGTSGRRWSNEKINGLVEDGDKSEFDEVEHVNQIEQFSEKQKSGHLGLSVNEKTDDVISNAGYPQCNIEDSRSNIIDSKAETENSEGNKVFCHDYGED